MTKEFVYLLWCTPDERLRVKKRVKVRLDRVKVCVVLDALDEIVFKTEVFDLVGRIVREDLRTHTLNTLRQTKARID